MTTLVVGASGFVGSHLVRRLHADQRGVRAAIHRSNGGIPRGIDTVPGSLDPAFDWRPALGGCDTVVHLAARVHIMRDHGGNPLADYRRTNVDSTLALARQAAEAGVRRFAFLSSVKACGEATALDHPLREDDLPAPRDPYGISKAEAEAGLRHLAAGTGLEVVILRPPLVYGPGVRANFRSMMHWLQRGWPLPLGCIDNRRSLIGIANLIDLITLCLDHPAAAGQTFFASDGEDLSTPDLLRRLAAALGTRARLVPVPTSLLIAAATIAGQAGAAQRLCGSLQVDIAKARTLFGWTPPLSVDDEIVRTARWWLDQRAGS
jgi:nucleoside-diphosphate-sugar epimerase